MKMKIIRDCGGVGIVRLQSPVQEHLRPACRYRSSWKQFFISQLASVPQTLIHSQSDTLLSNSENLQQPSIQTKPAVSKLRATVWTDRNSDKQNIIREQKGTHSFSMSSQFVLTSFHLTATINELRIWMNSISLLLDQFFFYMIETGEKAEREEKHCLRKEGSGRSAYRRTTALLEVQRTMRKVGMYLQST